MAKISQYPDSGALQDTDQAIIARAGNNFSVLLSRIAAYTGMPKGHLHGLTLSNNSGDATNDIDIAAGECRSDDDAEDMTLASGLTKQLDAVWAVGTNAGGRASGAAIANATYHVFLIKRPDTGVVDVAFDTSASGANLAANTDAAYTRKRRIGSIVRTGGAIKAFVQDGDTFMWKTPVSDVNAANPGTAAVTRTLTVPTGIRVQAVVSSAAFSSAGTAADFAGNVYLSDLSLDDVAPGLTAALSFAHYNSAVPGQSAGIFHVFTNTSAQIRSRVSQSTANTNFYINAHGWIDSRGRLVV